MRGSGLPTRSGTPATSCTWRIPSAPRRSPRPGGERRRRRADARPPAADGALARGLHAPRELRDLLRHRVALTGSARRSSTAPGRSDQAGRNARSATCSARRAAVPRGARAGGEPAPPPRQHARADRRLHARIELTTGEIDARGNDDPYVEVLFQIRVGRYVAMLVIAEVGDVTPLRGCLNTSPGRGCHRGREPCRVDITPRGGGRLAASIWRVRDGLWEAVAPLLPVHQPDPRAGRPRVDDRVCLGAIVFVLCTGIAWQHLPRELGCSPATAQRWLKEWPAGACSRRCTASCCAGSTPPDGSSGRPR